ncbi:MAG: hypothetical protein HY270_08075 [Deltaproteobacteria bacterium]|nr:hypothetical protein [Deltaproteobacteria bacterium]
MANKDTTHSHAEAVPVALESVIGRLRELEVVLGPQAAPAVAAIRSALVEALAARDRGDIVDSIRRIGAAMDRLTALADGLDHDEATMMRAVAQGFRNALLRGDEAQAKQEAAAMFARSGAVPMPKK